MSYFWGSSNRHNLYEDIIRGWSSRLYYSVVVWASWRQTAIVMLYIEITLDPPPISNYNWADSSQTVLMTCINAAYKTVVLKRNGKDHMEDLIVIWEVPHTTIDSNELVQGCWLSGIDYKRALHTHKHIPCNRSWRHMWLWDAEDPTFSRQ
jgi:hypothetical protein